VWKWTKPFDLAEQIEVQTSSWREIKVGFAPEAAVRDRDRRRRWLVWAPHHGVLQTCEFDAHGD
jgi:hypothetical protein